ncbi:MAG TPA: AbrB/MazE/SpoVT family DNA-binding domain-containing protein [Candidatus Saccharimonadia bacterium]|nr:AbrB/MazE/SpoVT family DNA-binding domain-containing protein [Candidatus Saccharimonadia bacterium]
MKYSSTMTSKGQVTIPVEIRRKLGLKPGQAVSFDLSGDIATIEQPDWHKELAALHARVREHMQRTNRTFPQTDDELREVRLQAHRDAAAYRVERMRESE